MYCTELQKLQKITELQKTTLNGYLIFPTDIQSSFNALRICNAYDRTAKGVQRDVWTDDEGSRKAQGEICENEESTKALIPATITKQINNIVNSYLQYCIILYIIVFSLNVQCN